MPELDQTKRWLTWMVYPTPLMTLTTDFGLSIRVSMFEEVRLVTGTSVLDHSSSLHSRVGLESQCLFVAETPFSCSFSKSDI